MQLSRKNAALTAILCAAVASAGLLLGMADSRERADEPANKKCPLMKKPVNSSNIMVDFDGKKIALCCTRCKRRWDGMDDEKRRAAVALVLASDTGPQAPADAAAATAGEERIGDPYTLDVCPISGEKLTSMGGPVTRVYEGREVRFCCDHCIATFEKDKAAQWAEIDKRLIESQKPIYALTTCPISGQALDDKAVDAVIGNRLVRFCCNKCVAEFRKDPKANFAKLDEAVIMTDGKAYPLTTCVVSGEALKIGKSHDIVVGGRLIRLCCEKCAADVEKDPAKYIAMVDAAKKPKPAK